MIKSLHLEERFLCIRYLVTLLDLNIVELRTGKLPVVLKRVSDFSLMILSHRHCSKLLKVITHVRL